jgi:Tol biopolymer transport system component
MIVARPTRQLPALIATVIIVASFVLSGCGQPDSDLTLNTPVSQTGADPSGRILLVSGGQVRMWDGGDIKKITDVGDEMEALSPTWAPDGNRFAYVQANRSKGYSDLYVANLDGETLKQVTNNAPDVDPYSQEFVCNAYWVADPVWDQAGERIIWASDRGGWEFDRCEDRLSDPMFLWYSETWDADPYILSATADIGLAQEGPSLSGNGQMAAFVVREEVTDSLRNPQIWTLDMNTAETTVLVDHPDGAYDPAWSPDDHNIAYIQRDANRNDVWIAPLGGNAPYRLTDIGTCVSPTWSPDGRFIAFFREVDGNFEAAYVEVEADDNGKLSASDPQKLFSADDISTISGMSLSDK